MTLDAARYAEQGFLVIPGFKPAAEIAALRERALQIVDAFDPGEQRPVFTTEEQQRHVDDYFLDSGSQIRCFFEEEAFDAAGRLRVDKALAINKIGHAMHDLDPVFSAFSKGEALRGVAAALGLTRPQVWQRMFIFKQPGIGGEVRWHQDASFFETDPVSVTTFWFALEDATLRNGCLWAEPAATAAPVACCVSASCARAARPGWSRSTPRPGRPRTPPMPCRWRWRPARWWFFTACCRITRPPTAPTSPAMPTPCT